jgi:hypothetical protein
MQSGAEPKGAQPALVAAAGPGAVAAAQVRQACAAVDWAQEAGRHCPESVQALLDEVQALLRAAADRQKVGDLGRAEAWLAKAYRDIAQLVCLADTSGAAGQLPEHVRDQLFPPRGADGAVA